jgi:hypothetical protein
VPVSPAGISSATAGSLQLRRHTHTASQANFPCSRFTSIRRTQSYTIRCRHSRPSNAPGIQLRAPTVALGDRLLQCPVGQRCSNPSSPPSAPANSPSTISFRYDLRPTRPAPHRAARAGRPRIAVRARGRFVVENAVHRVCRAVGFRHTPELASTTGQYTRDQVGASTTQAHPQRQPRLTSATHALQIHVSSRPQNTTSPSAEHPSRHGQQAQPLQSEHE